MGKGEQAIENAVTCLTWSLAATVRLVQLHPRHGHESFLTSIASNPLNFGRKT
jgi:hypothetical protein